MSTEAKPNGRPTPMYTNEVPQETFRALIGWAPESWSVPARSSLIAATPDQHSKAVLACKAQVAKRPAFIPTNPITEIEESGLVEAIKARPETAYVGTEVIDAGGSWRFAMVNLEEVLASQPLVRVDHLETHQVQGSLSDEQLYELCFPANRPISADEVTIGPVSNGYTVTTLDPNIRVIPCHSIPGIPAGTNPQSLFEKVRPIGLRSQMTFPQMSAFQTGIQLQYPSASSPFELHLFSFSLLRVPNYLQVVHYQDRYVLRNGYTRAADLLSRNIHIVPCMLIEAQNPALIRLMPGMFDLATVLSTHPPRIRDFWDDTVVCLLQRPAVRYVYHVNVNIMPVPR
jgi:hypothetical protein